MENNAAPSPHIQSWQEGQTTNGILACAPRRSGFWTGYPSRKSKEQGWYRTATACSVRVAVIGGCGLSAKFERPRSGLQGWYNIMHARGHINIPHGDILLFGAACGQIVSRNFLAV